MTHNHSSTVSQHLEMTKISNSMLVSLVLAVNMLFLCFIQSYTHSYEQESCKQNKSPATESYSFSEHSLKLPSVVKEDTHCYKIPGV